HGGGRGSGRRRGAGLPGGGRLRADQPVREGPGGGFGDRAARHDPRPHDRSRVETDRTGKRMKRIAIAAVALALLISGCNATKVSDLQSRGELKPGSKPCGTFNLAVNSWVGYEANAAVITYLAENVLGCVVKQRHIAEQVSWKGMSTGQVDAILENWGHDDLKKQYIDNMGVAEG